MEFSRQELWSGLTFPSPGDLPNQGIKLTSPALAGGFFTTEPPGKPTFYFYYYYVFGCTESPCAAQASLFAALWLSCPKARGILVPPPEMECQSPALEGRFLTTEPPGKTPLLVQFNLM